MRTLDLFTGIAGFAVALSKATEVVAYCDKNENNYDVFQPVPARQAPPPVLPMTRTPPFPPQPPSWGSALQHHTQQQVIPPPASSSARAGGFPGWM